LCFVEFGVCRRQINSIRTARKHSTALDCCRVFAECWISESTLIYTPYMTRAGHCEYRRLVSVGDSLLIGQNRRRRKIYGTVWVAHVAEAIQRDYNLISFDGDSLSSDHFRDHHDTNAAMITVFASCCAHTQQVQLSARHIGLQFCYKTWTLVTLHIGQLR